MRSSPVAELRVHKSRLEKDLAKLLADGDAAAAEKLKIAIARIESYLRSFGALVRTGQD